MKIRAFTLIEIMVVLILLALLTTFAHQAYRSYAVRSRVSEALQILEEYKFYATSLQAREGEIKAYYVLFTDEDTTGFISGTPAGTSAVKAISVSTVSRISVDTGTSGSDKYTLIGAELDNTGGITDGSDYIYIAGIEGTNGVTTWYCGRSSSKANSVPENYLPSDCRESLP